MSGKRVLGFIGTVKIDSGRVKLRPHDVVVLPEANADELLQAEPDACDLTPNAASSAYGVSMPSGTISGQSVDWITINPPTHLIMGKPLKIEKT